MGSSDFNSFAQTMDRRVTYQVHRNSSYEQHNHSSSVLMPEKDTAEQQVEDNRQDLKKEKMRKCGY